MPRSVSKNYSTTYNQDLRSGLGWAEVLSVSIRYPFGSHGVFSLAIGMKDPLRPCCLLREGEIMSKFAVS